MPFVHITIPTTLTAEKRQKLMRDIVDRTHQAIGSDPAIINVVILELPPFNVSVGAHAHHE